MDLIPEQNRIYPWQNALWNNVESRIQAREVPSGLLLAGPAGIGKKQFARQLAKRLLCQSPTEEQGIHLACGQCRHCNWVENGTHPDLFEVHPEGKSETIKVEQIRTLCNSLIMTSHAGGYKAGVIYAADRMNLNAANSLLKSLEEPTSDTVFILVSNEPGRLPVTIRSRCQRYEFKPAEPQLALQWLSAQGVEQAEACLKLAQGAPIQAKELCEAGALDARRQRFAEFRQLTERQTGVSQQVQSWIKLDLAQLFQWMSSWIRDLIRLQLAVNPDTLENSDLDKDLRTLNVPGNLTLLFKDYEVLAGASRALNTSVNTQLLLESVVTRFHQWYSPRD